MSYTQFGPDRFSRFDVYWIQTYKQTDTMIQTKQTPRQSKLYTCTFTLILLKKIGAQKVHLQSLKCPRERAIIRNIFEYLFAKFDRSKNKSRMRYIKLLVQGIHFRGQNSRHIT